MKVAVAGLGWWGKQIIACLDRSPRFEVLYGIDPKPPADVEEFRKSHKFTLDTTPRQGARRSGDRGRGARDPARAPRGAVAPRDRRRQEPLLREAADHDRRRREARGRGVPEGRQGARRRARAALGAGLRGTAGGSSTPERSASSSSSRPMSAMTSSASSPRTTGGSAQQRPGRHDDRGRHPPHRPHDPLRRPRRPRSGRGRRA